MEGESSIFFFLSVLFCFVVFFFVVVHLFVFPSFYLGLDQVLKEYLVVLY